MCSYNIFNYRNDDKMKIKDKEIKPDELTTEDLLGLSEKQDEKFKFANSLYDGIKTITDIPSKEIKNILKLYFFSTECSRFEVNPNLPKITDIINNNLEDYFRLRISNKRLGREEAIRFLTSDEKKEVEKSGMFNRLFK